MENTNKIPEEDNRVTIRNKTLLYDTAFNQYVKWHALFVKNFVGCRFKKIDFSGNPINFCKFKNCEFNDFYFRKCNFAKCTFENCRIVKSNLTRADFDYCNFINCNFLQSNLFAIDFSRCEFSETTFKRCDLDRIQVKDVKVWKSKSVNLTMLMFEQRRWNKQSVISLFLHA